MAPEQTRAQPPGEITDLSSGRTPEKVPARVMDDVDAYPWSTVSHAYGPAEDLPGLLRVLAEGEPDAAGEAVSELYGSVLHQAPSTRRAPPSPRSSPASPRPDGRGPTC
ncbi:hypothetical protein OHB11_06590 [Streptomyces zaomyceticus]|uniref:hypothetical protein n=1 Tax=Streptomyces zaomyceticus TaxID=68286 RepID=UPI00324F8C97